MVVKIGKTPSEPNRVNKTFNVIAELDATILNGSNILTPTLEIAFSDDYFTCNYLYVPDFKRYYFITDMTLSRGNIYIVKCKVDVLQTYSSEIRAQTAILKRNELDYNTYLPDNKILVFKNTQTQAKKFSKSFTPDVNGFSFVLQIAGG